MCITSTVRQINLFQISTENEALRGCNEVPSTGVRLFTGGEIDQFMRGMIPCYLFNYFFVYIYCSEINNLCSMLNVLS